jgi:hypothetical protein
MNTDLALSMRIMRRAATMSTNAHRYNQDGGEYTCIGAGNCILVVEAAPTDPLYYEERAMLLVAVSGSGQTKPTRRRG